MAAFISEGSQFEDTDGKPIVNGFIYIGLKNADPKISSITIYSDRALTVVLANPQRTDSAGRSVNKIWIPAEYSIKVEDENNVQKFQDLDAGKASVVSVVNLINVVGTNVITADASPTITKLVDKQQYIFQTVGANDSDVVTLKIGVLATVTGKRNLNQDIVKGQFQDNQDIVFIYNLSEDVFEWANQNHKVDYWSQGADIASAATVDLSLATGNSVRVTGWAGPITSFGTTPAGPVYKIWFPLLSGVSITSSSVANPSNILAVGHGLLSGQSTVIAGHSGSTPNINATHVVTVIDVDNFTIPINVTVPGTGGTSTGILVITDSSAISWPVGDIHVGAGDVLELVSLGSGDYVATNYQMSTGVALRGPETVHDDLIGNGGDVTTSATTSGTAVDTGLTVTITPRAAQKVLLILDAIALHSAGVVFLELRADGVFIANAHTSSHIVWLHSPATTAPVVYSVFMYGSEAGTATLFGTTNNQSTLTATLVS